MKGKKSEGGREGGREGGVEEESELDWDRRGFGDEKKGGRRGGGDSRESGERKVTGWVGCRGVEGGRTAGWEEGRREGEEDGRSLSGGIKKNAKVPHCDNILLNKYRSVSCQNQTSWSPLFVTLLLRNSWLKLDKDR